MYDMSMPDFENLIGEALDGMPFGLLSLIENVVVMAADLPDDGRRNLLGLYTGIPLTKRGAGYAGVLPDRIFIYRIPILLRCSSYEDVFRQVRVTVVHEIAHHFGVSDARLRELGY